VKPPVLSSKTCCAYQEYSALFVDYRLHLQETWNCGSLLWPYTQNCHGYKRNGFSRICYLHAHNLLAYHQLTYFRMVVVTEQMGFL